MGLGSRWGSTYYLLLSNLWELLLRLLIMPCYASRCGLGECIHDRCEIDNIEYDYEDESDDEESLFILEGYLFDQDASLAILAKEASWSNK